MIIWKLHIVTPKKRKPYIMGRGSVSFTNVVMCLTFNVAFTGCYIIIKYSPDITSILLYFHAPLQFIS